MSDTLGGGYANTISLVGNYPQNTVFGGNALAALQNTTTIGYGAGSIIGCPVYIGAGYGGAVPNTPTPDVLNLNDQNLSSLDGQDLTRCKRLQVSGNRLTELPPLPENITELHCSNNLLKTIPPSKTLQSIFCRDNPLTHFYFSNFPALKQLSIDEDVLLNSDLFAWPENITINADTQGTLESVLDTIKLRMDWEKTFAEWSQRSYRLDSKKYNDSKARFESL